MAKTTIWHQTQDLLQQLEQALTTAELWATEAPSQEAMASTAPFCCDKMSFENWLQFIFIPKMTVLITMQSPLPEKISLLPMAEETMESGAKTAEVFAVIGAIDKLLGKGA